MDKLEEAINLIKSSDDNDLNRAIELLQIEINKNPNDHINTDPCYNYMGKAFWKKAKLTGFTNKKMNDKAWRYINKAQIAWFHAIRTPSACNDLTKSRRFQASFYYNQGDLRSAIKMIDEIERTEDINKNMKGQLLTDSDIKKRNKWKQELKKITKR